MRYDRPVGTPMPMSLFDTVPSLTPGGPAATIDEAFARFHAANPWVYEALRRLAVDLVERGRRRIGMKMLFEVLRWHYARSTVDASSDFKLNNNYTSRYARLLMEREPRLVDVFETRELQTP